MKHRDDAAGEEYLTPEGIHRLQSERERLEAERPRIVEELSRAIALGDLSENAEYQDAKHRLSRLDGRVFSITEKLKKAVVISSEETVGTVRLGSSVRVVINGKTNEYRLVGPQESNPSHGRISHLSPLGAALLGRCAGEKIFVQTENGGMEYEIVEIR